MAHTARAAAVRSLDAGIVDEAFALCDVDSTGAKGATGVAPTNGVKYNFVFHAMHVTPLISSTDVTRVEARLGVRLVRAARTIPLLLDSSAATYVRCREYTTAADAESFSF